MLYVPDTVPGAGSPAAAPQVSLPAMAELHSSRGQKQGVNIIQCIMTHVMEKQKVGEC